MMYFIKRFFKRLFCHHAYPRIVYSTDCIEERSCEKCGKIKTFYFHDYETVRSYIEVKKESGLTYGFQKNYYVRINRCTKCNVIDVDKTLI